MDDSPKLSPSNTVLVAKELTIKAMENGLIGFNPDPAATAANVVTFYHTVLTTLNE